MTEEKQPNPDKKVSVELTLGQLFQLNLCVVARLSAAQMKFANAYCEDEQKSAEGLMAYLTSLSTVIAEALKNGQE